MDLCDFLSARYDEDEAFLFGDARLTVAGVETDESWRHFVRFRDNLAVNRTLVRTAANIPPDTEAALTLRVVLLCLAQPFEPHPDFDRAWLAELAALMTPTGA